MMDDCPLTEICVRCLGLAGSLWFGGGVDLPFFTASTGLIQSNSSSFHVLVVRPPITTFGAVKEIV